MTDPTYQASPTKRHRSTKAEVEHRRNVLYEIVSAMRPMTVRQVFYQATVRGIVEKAETGYAKVQTDLTLMRKSGALPYGWLVDNTRWQRKPRTFSGIDDALYDTAKLYRKSLWADANAYVEIWIEKDALTGVVYPVTDKYDVPLMVARGFSSLSFVHDTGEYLNDVDVPVYIYHFGDYDPSGVAAAFDIEAKLRHHAPNAEIHFERVAVTEAQIDELNLPTRPTKLSDTRAKSFGAISVDLDAIEPQRLRDMVDSVIQRHMPPEQFKILMVAEESERQLIRDFVGQFNPHLLWD